MGRLILSHYSPWAMALSNESKNKYGIFVCRMCPSGRNHVWCLHMQHMLNQYEEIA